MLRYVTKITTEAEYVTHISQQVSQVNQTLADQEVHQTLKKKKDLKKPIGRPKKIITAELLPSVASTPSSPSHSEKNSESTGSILLLFMIFYMLILYVNQDIKQFSIL
jgi:hypothetical protein